MTKTTCMLTNTNVGYTFPYYVWPLLFFNGYQKRFSFKIFLWPNVDFYNHFFACILWKPLTKMINMPRSESILLIFYISKFSVSFLIHSVGHHPLLQDFLNNSSGLLTIFSRKHPAQSTDMLSSIFFAKYICWLFWPLLINLSMLSRNSAF